MSTTKTRVLLCGKQGGVRRLCFLENATRTRFVLRSLYIMSGVILGIYILRHCSLHVWSLNRFFHDSTQIPTMWHEHFPCRWRTTNMSSQLTSEGHYGGKMRTFSPRHRDNVGVFSSSSRDWKRHDSRSGCFSLREQLFLGGSAPCKKHPSVCVRLSTCGGSGCGNNTGWEVSSSPLSPFSSSPGVRFHTAAFVLPLLHLSSSLSCSLPPPGGSLQGDAPLS